MGKVSYSPGPVKWRGVEGAEGVRKGVHKYNEAFSVGFTYTESLIIFHSGQ